MCLEQASVWTKTAGNVLAVPLILPEGGGYLVVRL